MLIFRFFRIITVSLIFRLDEYYLSHPKALWFRYVLSLVLFWRSKEGARGYRIRRALETLGPIFVKFGQVLSTRRDLIPLDIADELAFLQDKVLPAKTEEIKEILTSKNKSYYDTNIKSHHHFYDEGTRELTDIHYNQIRLSKVPVPPKGKKIKNLEVVIRIQK